jgi:hypothetical protein
MVLCCNKHEKCTSQEQNHAELRHLAYAVTRKEKQVLNNETVSTQVIPTILAYVHLAFDLGL